jgi:hypothetical protein
MGKADLVNMLGNLGGGQSIHQINDAIADVVLGVLESGKKGTFQLTLTFTKNGDIGIKVDDSHKATVPKPSVGSTLFFVDEHGNMQRRDPRQRELFTEAPRRRPPADEDEDEGGAAVN